MRSGGNRFRASQTGTLPQGIAIKGAPIVGGQLGWTARVVSLGDSSISPARSVGRAAPDAVYLSDEIDSRLAFDTCTPHFGFEFVGSYECARLLQTLPFEEECKVVDVSSAAENTATALAVFTPKVKGGIERRFPGRIVGNLVLDENVDHDVGGTPFALKTLLQTQEKCKGRDHRGLDLRAGCFSFRQLTAGPDTEYREANGRDGEI